MRPTLKLLISTLVVLSSTPAIAGKEFNYDRYQRYSPFDGSRGAGCDSTYKLLHDNLTAGVTYSAPSEQDVEINCENLAQMRSRVSQEVKKIRSLAAPFSNYADKCLCDAYVALRLSDEGYSSARSGGVSLDFKKTLAGFADAKRISANLDSQIERLERTEWKIKDIGRKICSGSAGITCGADVIQANCRGEKQEAYLNVDDNWDFFRGIRNSVWQVSQKTVRGVASLTDYKGPAPYCQNIWGEPGTGEPKYINETYKNSSGQVTGFSSRTVFEAPIPSTEPVKEVTERAPTQAEPVAAQPAPKRKRGLFDWMFGRKRDRDQVNQPQQQRGNARSGN